MGTRKLVLNIVLVSLRLAESGQPTVCYPPRAWKVKNGKAGVTVSLSAGSICIQFQNDKDYSVSAYTCTRVNETPI